MGCSVIFKLPDPFPEYTSYVFVILEEVDYIEYTVLVTDKPTPCNLIGNTVFKVHIHNSSIIEKLKACEGCEDVLGVLKKELGSGNISIENIKVTEEKVGTIEELSNIFEDGITPKGVP